VAECDVGWLVRVTAHSRLVDLLFWVIMATTWPCAAATASCSTPCIRAVSIARLARLASGLHAMPRHVLAKATRWDRLQQPLGPPGGRTVVCAGLASCGEIASAGSQLGPYH
jgi:hypothetical protein